MCGYHNLINNDYFDTVSPRVKLPLKCKQNKSKSSKGFATRVYIIIIIFFLVREKHQISLLLFPCERYSETWNVTVINGNSCMYIYVPRNEAQKNISLYSAKLIFFIRQNTAKIFAPSEVGDTCLDGIYLTFFFFCGQICITINSRSLNYLIYETGCIQKYWNIKIEFFI